MCGQFRILAVTAAAMLVGGASGAKAHDIWLTTAPMAGNESQQIVIGFGDPKARELAVLSRIVSLDVVSTSGTQSLRQQPITAIKAGGAPALQSSPVSLPSDSVIYVVYDNGFWARTPNGELNTSKAFYPDAQESFWTTKYGKMLVGPGSYKRVVGSPIEIVPLDDPYKLSAGQTLRVRLDLRKQPLGNQEIMVGDGLTMGEKDLVPARTDAQGVATIKLDRRGAYVLSVEYMASGSYPQLGVKDHLYSTLAFVLP